MTTWSLTPFFNELDVLEIRLRELEDAVDVFVIAEATVTHAGVPKPLHFRESSGRFARWADRIRYVVVDDMPAGEDRTLPDRHFQATDNDNWARERHQRDALSRGCEDMEEDDLVMLSDLDEIPGANTVYDMDIEVTHGEVVRVHLPQHVMYLDWRWRERTTHTILRFASGRTLAHLGGPQALREYERGKIVHDVDGWHLSYMGGPERVRDKILASAHAELSQKDYADLDAIERRMSRGVDMFDRSDRIPIPVPLSRLPRAVREDPPRFAHLLSEEGRAP